MKEFTWRCDFCGGVIKNERNERWQLVCPPGLKGIDYDLCGECNNRIHGHFNPRKCPEEWTKVVG